MDKLVSLLIEKELTIASIESITGGLFAAKIAAIPHASKTLKGALVSYQTEIKTDVLKIPKTFFEKNAVISQACADEMALCGKKLFSSDIVVSCSGNAGPDAMDNEPVGKVYMSIAFKEKLYRFECIFEGERNTIRDAVCMFLAEKIYALVI